MPDRLTEISGRRPAPASEAAPGFNLSRDDIFFIVFRHKWLILGLACLGAIGAAAAWFLQPAVYRSEAKLLVLYVLESRGGGISTDNQVKSPDSRGDNIINSEIEILTSLDICEQAAKGVGVDKVLGRPGDTNQSVAAGATLKGGLTVDVPRKSNVIKIGLQHRDPEVAARGLGQLVDAYLRRHIEVHRGIGGNAALSREKDRFRTRLAETELALRQYRTNFVGGTLEDARKALTDQLTRIRQEIFVAETQLAEALANFGPIASNAAVAALRNSTAATNAAASTNLSQEPASPSVVSEYRTLCTRLDSLRVRELDLLSQFTPENSVVRRLQDQIVETEVRKRLLEEEHPALVRMEATVRAPGGPTVPAGSDRPQLPGIQARISVLTNQLAQVKAEIAALDGVEGEVQTLQRTKELDEKNYRYYAAGIEQAAFDSVVANDKLSNISLIEAPTPPFRDNSKRSKLTLGMLGFGVLGGLVFAFLFEIFLDHTLKRPGDVEDRLHVALFASIPRLPSAGAQAALPGPDGLSHGMLSPPDADTELGPRSAIWSSGHPLRPYFQGLRDRTLLFFEGVTRKPKLLGVTSCGHRSGVTTTAVGLAAALSETGSGNVLLVDLNLENRAAHPFFHGQPGCGLADAIETDTRQGGQVSDNLYLAHARNGGGGSESLPQRLSQLVPRLRVSDYDYIVFDMPKVTQTGVTARLAGMMDLVLLVMEAEKEQRDVLERALSLLTGCGAKVAGVLNKVHPYVPRRLRSHYYESTAAP